MTTLFDETTLARVNELVGRFVVDLGAAVGEGKAGEALLGVALDHLVEEGWALDDILSVASGCFDRGVTMRELDGRRPPDPGAPPPTDAQIVVGRRVTGEGDGRVVGVTWCAGCERINGHDDLGVCARCVGPVAALRVPLADVARVLEAQDLFVAGPASALGMEEMAVAMLRLGQLSYPLAPANYVLGVGVGALARHGESRETVLDCAAASFDASVAIIDAGGVASERTMLS